VRVKKGTGQAPVREWSGVKAALKAEFKAVIMDTPIMASSMIHAVVAVRS